MLVKSTLSYTFCKRSVSNGLTTCFTFLQHCCTQVCTVSSLSLGLIKAFSQHPCPYPPNLRWTLDATSFCCEQIKPKNPCEVGKYWACLIWNSRFNFFFFNMQQYFAMQAIFSECWVFWVAAPCSYKFIKTDY